MKRSPFGLASRSALCLCLARCIFVDPLGSEPEPGSGGAAGLPQGGTSNSGGANAESGAAGESAGGAGASAALGGAAGSSGFESGGAGDVTNSAGAGGAGAAPGRCETNADCSRRGFDEPFRCMPDKTCVALKTADCPVVIGNALDDNAVYLGGYGTNEAGVGLQRSTEVFTYQLALDDFDGDARHGLPGGPGGTRRQVVMVVCDNNPNRLKPTITHLTSEVQVPGILAALDVGQLLSAYEQSPQTFFLSPYGGSHDLSIKPDQGLIWSMLGQPSDFDAIYAATLARIETFINASQAPATLRVATIQTDDAFSSELAQAVLARLEFNGQSVTKNRADGNYLGRTLKVADFSKDIDQVVMDVAAFEPNVVISLANELFVVSSGVLPRIEDQWGLLDGDPPRPFYVLSPKNTDTLEDTVGKLVEQEVKNGATLAYQRFFAIGAAPAADRTLYNDFETRLLNTYPTAHPEAENLYDAAYFLTYSLYAAGNVALAAGPDLARGMLRLLSTDERVHYSVGPTDIESAFMALDRKDSAIRLVGTLGPPDFDVSAGVRIESGSVSCFDKNAGVHYHVLRYDRSTQALVGDFSPCYAGF